MPTADRWIAVEAPVEDVFEFVADYRNTARHQMQFTSVEAIGEPRYGFGLVVDARGRFKGIPIRAKLKIVEFARNELIVSSSVSGLKSRAEWRFEKASHSTRVRLTATYDYPIPVLTSTLRRMVEREIESLVEQSLRNLKRLVEVQVSQRLAAASREIT